MFARAARQGVRAALAEDAALGKSGEVGHLARDRRQHPGAGLAVARIAFDEAAGIGVLGVGEERPDVGLLDDLTGIHHRRPKS